MDSPLDRDFNSHVLKHGDFGILMSTLFMERPGEHQMENIYHLIYFIMLLVLLYYLFIYTCYSNMYCSPFNIELYYQPTWGHLITDGH